MRNIAVLIASLFLLPALSVYSHSLCVNVPEANLRSGPGTKYEKTWKVFKYMPFEKLGSRGSWYRVSDVDGDMHWIYRNLVTEEYKCAVVRVDRANVRTGPGTNYNENVLSPALKYDSFRVVETRRSWVKIKDEFGDQGWIFKDLVWIQ